MTDMLPSRRHVLAAALLPTAAALRAAVPKNVGVQLYTVRTPLDEKPDATLEALAQIGYRNAEILMPHVKLLAPTLKRVGLQPVSVHVDPALLADAAKDAELQRLLADAKAIGVRHAVMPYLRPDQRGKADAYRRLAERLNRVGTMCRSEGLGFAYHNHAFEFGTVDGVRPMDVILKGTDPKLMQIEADVFWLSVAGLDPVTFLQEQGRRVRLLHLKDKAKGTPQQFNEGVQRTAFRELGNGELDIPAIVKAAQGAGVEYLFVEQDQTEGDPVASLRQSWQYLAKAV